MELRSTGNPDINNPVTMSVLEYLRKKGIEAMGMTNGERIRDMSDEELAKFIESVQCYGHGWCEKCSSMNGDYCNGMRANEPDEDILRWLKQPVGEWKNGKTDTGFNWKKIWHVGSNRIFRERILFV